MPLLPHVFVVAVSVNGRTSLEASDTLSGALEYMLEVANDDHTLNSYRLLAYHGCPNTSAFIHLKTARDLLRKAGASKAADYVARALKSAEGAKRHAVSLGRRA